MDAPIVPPITFSGRLPLGVTSRGAFIYATTDTALPERFVRPGRGYRAGVRTQYTARADEEGHVSSVTESTAWRIVGPSTSGKGYTRWSPNTMTVVRRLPSSRRTVFGRVWTRRGQRCFGSAFYDGDTTLSPALLELATELLGRAPTFAEAHPLLREDHRFSIENRAFLRAFWRVEEVRDLTRNLFGVSRYRKDLVKAVAVAYPLSLFVAWSLRGLVPTDWLVDVLRRHTGDAEEGASFDNGRRIDWVPQGELRRHLRGLDMVTLRRLTRDVAGLTHERVRDLTWMAPAPPRRVRTWDELHDYTARIDNRTRLAGLGGSPASSTPDDVPWTADRSALAGTTEGGLRVVAAVDVRTLLDWGQEAHNCIGSYWEALELGVVHLLGIYECDRLVANAEIKPGPPPRLGQLRGPFNDDLPRDRYEDIVAFLTNRGVDCIGSPGWSRDG